MALEYNGVINAGHIFTAVTMCVSALSAVVWIQFELGKLAEEQRRIEALIATELATIRSDASARENRLRAAELVIAGQTSDLRSINATTTRIERQLEALLKRD